jgi:hypothetical protein
MSIKSKISEFFQKKMSNCGTCWKMMKKAKNDETSRQLTISAFVRAKYEKFRKRWKMIQRSQRRKKKAKMDRKVRN